MTLIAPMHNKSRLLVREAIVASPVCRLFCFPYAGGNSTIYRGWQAALGSGIEVVSVEPPGRGKRFLEAPISDLKVLIGEMIKELPALMTVPSIFFGHSNGALMCYELAHELRRQGMPMPLHLILSAKQPPHIPDDKNLHNLPTAELLEELKALNGTPPEILAHAELMEIVLPLLRADFSLGETYQHGTKVPLDCQMTLLGGTDDPDLSIEELAEWEPYGMHEATVHALKGDHFFIHACREEVLQIVKQVIATQIDAPLALRKRTVAG
jgi:medium-chain acyl-[acyl-carrier-protein] hydrolase